MAGKGWRAVAKSKARRLAQLDGQLRNLAVRYTAYKGLFERAMDIIKDQGELIRYYADQPEEHSYFTRRMTELKQQSPKESSK